MALTNYLSATVVFCIIAVSGWDFSPLSGLADGPSGTWLAIIIVVTIMLICQSILSTLWLYKFHQGPLEKAWRYLTWKGEPMIALPAQQVIDEGSKVELQGRN